MQIDIEQCIAQTGMTRNAVLNVLVAEAFMRRAALVNGPFALKGSLVLRQYLPEPEARIPGDLDWVGLGPLDENVLSSWVQEITAVDLDDGVEFRSFSENRFWRSIDYAMDDDFPTVNTDLLARVNGETHELGGMDVTFGLKLDPPPIPLFYRGIDDVPFDMPTTCPLELQLAWKLHQSMVRPRFKDLIDLLMLLKANSPDVAQTTAALRDECIKDRVPLYRFEWLLNGTLAQHPVYTAQAPGHGRAVSMAERYAIWHEGKSYTFESPAKLVFRQPNALPASIDELLSQLSKALCESGFQPFDWSPASGGGSPNSFAIAAASTETKASLWAKLKRWL